MVASREHPRELFFGRTGLRRNLRWDALDAVYFAGYAWWNYINHPYLLTREGMGSRSGSRGVRTRRPGAGWRRGFRTASTRTPSASSSTTTRSEAAAPRLHGRGGRRLGARGAHVRRSRRGRRAGVPDPALGAADRPPQPAPAVPDPRFSATLRDRGRVRMSDSKPVLWHIPVSHYSEKARWALAHKGIDHDRRSPVLGAHRLRPVAHPRGPQDVSVLTLEGRNIGDSTAIIAALEQRWPEPPLYPEDPRIAAGPWRSRTGSTRSSAPDPAAGLARPAHRSRAHAGARLQDDPARGARQRHRPRGRRPIRRYVREPAVSASRPTRRPTRRRQRWSRRWTGLRPSSTAGITWSATRSPSPT